MTAPAADAAAATGHVSNKKTDTEMQSESRNVFVTCESMLQLQHCKKNESTCRDCWQHQTRIIKFRLYMRTGTNKHARATSAIWCSYMQLLDALDRSLDKSGHQMSETTKSFNDLHTAKCCMDKTSAKRFRSSGMSGP